MPNSDDKNWVRLCITIDAFFARFGHWPDRVRIQPECFDLLRDFELGPDAFRDLQAKVELIPDDVTFLAEDDAGRRLEYGGDFGPFDIPMSAADWLSVISIEQRRETEGEQGDAKTRLTEAIRVSGVCERDLDLLLLEELFSSSEFRSFTSEAAGLPELAEESLASVYRSVTHSSGESDLELYLKLADGRRAVLLIENKIDASLQPAQAERYRQRAGAYLTANEVDMATTLLVAPDRYFGSPDDRKGFDARLTYEEIDAWLSGQAHQGPRVQYKRYLLRSAIEKGTHGYQAVADEQMTALWKQYWEWAKEAAPELNMKRPGGKPAGSTHIFFRPDQFPKELLLVHKFRQGFVDLEFTRWGDRLAELREAIGGLAPSETSIVRISNSAAIRWPVPVVVPAGLQTQEQEALVGLRAASVLLGWYRDNEAAVGRILLVDN